MDKQSILEEGISWQAMRAVNEAFGKINELSWDESYMISCEIRFYSDTWPGNGPNGRSRSRLIGSGSCAYVSNMNE